MHICNSVFRDDDHRLSLSVCFSDVSPARCNSPASFLLRLSFLDHQLSLELLLVLLSALLNLVSLVFELEVIVLVPVEAVVSIGAGSSTRDCRGAVLLTLAVSHAGDGADSDVLVDEVLGGEVDEGIVWLDGVVVGSLSQGCQLAD